MTTFVCPSCKAELAELLGPHHVAACASCGAPFDPKTRVGAQPTLPGVPPAEPPKPDPEREATARRFWKSNRRYSR